MRATHEHLDAEHLPRNKGLTEILGGAVHDLQIVAERKPIATNALVVPVHAYPNPSSLVVGIGVGALIRVPLEKGRNRNLGTDVIEALLTVTVPVS